MAEAEPRPRLDMALALLRLLIHHETLVKSVVFEAFKPPSFLSVGH